MSKRPKLTQQRKLQALEAAVEVIGERGLCDTRVADVAERAGLSPALLLYYFDSKEKLLTEALTFSEDRFYLNTFHALSEVDDARIKLVRLIELAIPPDSPSGDWTLWVELWARALRDEEAAKKREALDRRWRNTMADIVRSGQRDGVFSREDDPDEVALRLAALMDGLLIQHLLGDPDIDSQKMLRICVDAAERDLAFELPDHGLEPVSSTRRRSARSAG